MTPQEHLQRMFKEAANDVIASVSHRHAPPGAKQYDSGQFNAYCAAIEALANDMLEYGEHICDG